MEDCENEKLKWEHKPAGPITPRYFVFSQTSTSVFKTYGNMGKNVFDTNSRRLINVALFVSFRAMKNWHDIFGIFFSFFKALRLVFFYAFELIFRVSFRVRTKFRITLNNVMSVWQLATTVAAILVLPICHSGGFTFVAGWAIQLYIDQWNLHFDKEGYFHVLIFYGLFYKRNKQKHSISISISPKLSRVLLFKK